MPQEWRDEALLKLSITEDRYALLYFAVKKTELDTKGYTTFEGFLKDHFFLESEDNNVYHDSPMDVILKRIRER